MKNKVIIIGGGLWGGLLAWTYQKRMPETDFVLYESGSKLGGNHTWCFHDSDISQDAMKLLTPFLRKSWDKYEVSFPSYRRVVDIPYHAISSDQFDKIIKETIPESKIRLNSSINVTEALDEAKLVFDCRGLQTYKNCGHQKFLGLEVETSAPHGLNHPILMDATVPQLDGFRFIYVLPFNESTLLVEDTRYSNNPDLDITKYREEVMSFMISKGWKESRILREECGILPLPFHYERTQENFGDAINLRGIFHDTTGYSLPDAVRLIDSIVRVGMDKEKILARVRDYRKETESNRNFFCFLNRMMFQAADDNDRYKTLEFFYRAQESAISKFYAGKMSGLDKALFFLGKPPVSISRALQTIMRSGL